MITKFINEYYPDASYEEIHYTALGHIFVCGFFGVALVIALSVVLRTTRLVALYTLVSGQNGTDVDRGRD